LYIGDEQRAGEKVDLSRKPLDYLESRPDVINQLIEIDEAGNVTVTPWSNVNA
jgi:hypothetical protein